MKLRMKTPGSKSLRRKIQKRILPQNLEMILDDLTYIVEPVVVLPIFRSIHKFVDRCHQNGQLAARVGREHGTDANSADGARIHDNSGQKLHSEYYLVRRAGMNRN